MNIYKFNGKEVVIVDGNLIMEKTGLPLYENKDIIFYIDFMVVISLDYAKKIGIKDNETELTEDDFYTGGYCEPKEIDMNYCSLFENKSKEGLMFCSDDYARCDDFFRKYLVDQYRKENEFDKLCRKISEDMDNGLSYFNDFVAELLEDYGYCMDNLEDKDFFNYFVGDVWDILDSFSMVIFEKLNICEPKQNEIWDNIIHNLNKVNKK